ncbi:hypothetical protein HYV91_02550 [Candidatus Wolfebacteria bacterium]|nr:hypothetical protein [Candidatus Wolfebacteria bacterium]
MKYQRLKIKDKIFPFLICVFAFWFLIFDLLPAHAAILPAPSGPGGQYNYCDLLHLGQNIINFIVSLIFPIATVMVVVGGIFIMTAREKPDQAKKGREIATAAVIGILITLLSWLILDTIFKIVAGRSPQAGGGPAVIQGLGRPWNELRCGSLPYGSNPGY